MTMKNTTEESKLHGKYTNNNVFDEEPQKSTNIFSYKFKCISNDPKNY
jgi:hypothetical protein